MSNRVASKFAEDAKSAPVDAGALPSIENRSPEEKFTRI